MTTTMNAEPFYVAMARYEGLLEINRSMLDASKDDMGKEWEEAHDATSAAIGLLIDTPARTVTEAITKLRVVIRHNHLEGTSDDIDDPEVRARALADPMRDGAWPLVRVLEDLERVLTPHADTQVTLQRLAEKLLHWEEAERQAHSTADALEKAGADSGVPLLHLDGLDDLLEITVKRATAIRATTMMDLGHKGRILQVMTRATRWGTFELTKWEEALIASVADDAAAMPGAA